MKPNIVNLILYIFFLIACLIASFFLFLKGLNYLLNTNMQWYIALGFWAAIKTVFLTAYEQSMKSFRIKNSQNSFTLKTLVVAYLIFIDLGLIYAGISVTFGNLEGKPILITFRSLIFGLIGLAPILMKAYLEDYLLQSEVKSGFGKKRQDSSTQMRPTILNFIIYAFCFIACLISSFFLFFYGLNDLFDITISWYMSLVLWSGMKAVIGTYFDRNNPLFLEIKNFQDICLGLMVALVLFLDLFLMQGGLSVTFKFTEGTPLRFHFMSLIFYSICMATIWIKPTLEDYIMKKSIGRRR